MIHVAEKPIVTPCCGRGLDVRIAFTATPALGTTVDVECPYCGELIALVLHAVVINRN